MQEDHMTKGKRIAKGEIVIRLAENHRYKNTKEAWEAVGPIFARLIADLIKKRKQKTQKRTGGITTE